MSKMYTVTLANYFFSLWKLEQELQYRTQEITKLQQQLHSSELKKQAITQQLIMKEAELTRTEETARREQQQRQQKDRELVQAKQQFQKVSLICVVFLVMFLVTRDLSEYRKRS